MEGIIFDLDGTLIDSMWIWEKADRDILERYGYEMDEEYMEAISKLNNRQCLEYIVERYSLPMGIEELGKEINGEAFKYYSNNVKLKDGAYELVCELKKQGKKMAIATSCLRHMCEAALKNNNILNYFDAIIYSDEIEKNKSEPDIYIEAANLIGVPPENCIVFEDLPVAAKSARKAGMKVVGVYDSFSKGKENLMKEICHEYIRDFWQYHIKKYS